ncbi:MAG: glycoside hydrolase [Parabacteroides sp.]|nr:glycoside hydrolase [Parabacteroides sp.]
MKNFLVLAIGFIGTACLCVQAQSPAFDPLLDSACQIVRQADVEKWNSSYMWYPGQLSAHMQKQQKRKSEERCTYVGYPGKFYKDASYTIFRKQVRLKQETAIQWAGPESIACSVDGQRLDRSIRGYTLKAGTHTLVFEVSSADRLPCLIVKGEAVSDRQGWQVSLDGETWNEPETDAFYNKPSVLPDAEQEIVTRILPDQYMFIRNVSDRDGELVLGKNARVVIDFRHLEVGNIRLHVKGSGKLSFFVGESPEEVLNDNLKDFEQRPIPSFSLNGQTQEIVLPERALRYLRIESEQPCSIASACLEAKVWPVEFQMQFECNDPAINDLWNAGIATLHTSLHNFYLDGVKRDYLPWAMDAIASSFAGDYLFGDEQVSRNGLSVALMPPNPETADLGIVDYPLHALIGFKQNYMRYGNIQTSLLFKDRIVQMLALYESLQDENGFISDRYSTTGFIPGWATKMGPGRQGIPAYGQILLYQNYVIGAYFARLWNESKLAKKYEKKAEMLGKHILEHFWDEDRKAFINGYTKEGEKDTRISHHAQYWAILAGLYPQKYYDYLFDKVLPEIPYYKEDISYEKGYEFLAYAKAGKVKEMFSLLDWVWGDWLRQGNTRFPENFSPDASLKRQLVFYDRPFGLSLCHGANGAPPVVAVLHGIWGFSQSDKHLAEYHLKPELLNLEWAKGSIPLKEGAIKLCIHKTGTSYVEIPNGCIVTLSLGNHDKPLVFKKAGRYEFVYE